MAVRFFGKNPQRRYVRQIPNRKFGHVVPQPEKKEEVVKKQVEKKEEVVEKIEENKTNKQNKDMADERLKKIEQITGAKAPKRRVKVEKKDKGLIERTENSTILLTEDNKMLLND